MKTMIKGEGMAEKKTLRGFFNKHGKRQEFKISVRYKIGL